MQVGDLVTIYYVDHTLNARSEVVDKCGLLIETVGHKASVLVDDEIENWDISDLLKMRGYKNESL